MNPPAKQPALVDVTDREQLGVFAFERFEIELYFTHLLLKIACRDERSGTLYELFLKIDAIKENRNLSFKRNVIESLFPIRSERVPSGVTQRRKEPDCLAVLARLSVMLV